MKNHLFMLTAGLLLGFQAWASAPDEKAVLKHYADMAQAKYTDSLFTARTLRAGIEALVANPTEQNLAEARKAWVAARVPYQQSEVYRFGNAIVDDWEGKVNAWPLDEGLIDYVATSYGEESDENQAFRANVIANPKLKVGGKTIDASTIDKKLIAETLHELDGVEANVATGYHAIEFLLWGQDLNGTGPGAGARPATDFDPANCTGGHCDRRVAYLKAATNHLLDELEWITAQWAANGAARKALTDGDTKTGLTVIFTGMGSLSYGELAGERMKLGVMLHDPEAAQQFCRQPGDNGLTALRKRYHAAMDAWQAIRHIRFGPVELFLRHHRFQLWPDKRNSVGRHLGTMITHADPKVEDPARFAQASVAVQGMSALERLIFLNAA